MKKETLKFKKWLYKQSKESLIKIILSYWKGEKGAKEMTGLTNFDKIDLRNKFIEKYPNSATTKELKVYHCECEECIERGKSDERKRILEIIDGMSEELHIADIKELKRRVVERLE